MFDTIFQDVKDFLGTSFLEKKKYNSVAPIIVDEYNTYRNAGNKKIICNAPFTNIYFGRQGNVVSCCHNRKHVIGNYPQQTIEEIWNGEKLADLRNYIKHNDLNSGCHVCKWDMEQRNFEEVKALHFDSVPVLKKFPSMMEFELDNTCNLECTMCTGEFSSSIRKNREHKPAILSVYDDAFVNQLIPFIPYLKETRFSGGEPFLIDIYHKIWEKIVALNPNCLISVQTNGTTLNGRLKEIMENGNFEIGISLDSLQKNTYENIRKKARFETVMENIEYFADYCKRKNTTFRISVCAMRENWQEIPAYIDFCSKHNAYLQIHTVWFPPESALWNLDKNALDEIHSKISSFEFTENGFVSKRNITHYKNFIAQVEQWRSKASIKADIVIDINEDVSERREKLLNKIAEHIMSDAALSLANKEKKKEEILGKAKNVFAKFEDNQNMLSGFAKMMEVPVEIIVSVMQIENEERIYEYMVAFVRE